MSFDQEVLDALGPRPQPKPGGENLAAVIEYDRRYRELFPTRPRCVPAQKGSK